MLCFIVDDLMEHFPEEIALLVHKPKWEDKWIKILPTQLTHHSLNGTLYLRKCSIKVIDSLDYCILQWNVPFNSWWEICLQWSK